MKPLWLTLSLCFVLACRELPAQAGGDQTAQPSSTSIPAAIGAQRPTISTTNLDFGKQALNATSAPRVITVRNDSKQNISIDKISASSSEFQLTQNCRTQLHVLPPDSSCSILVTFTPSQSGLQSAKIAVSIPDAQPLIVNLEGTGVVSAIALSDTHLVFRDQLVNTRSKMQIINFQNRRGMRIALEKIDVSDGFVLLPTQDQCLTGATVAAHGYCNLAVFFSPGKPGMIEGEITIADSDVASPHRIALTGRASAVKVSSPSLIWKDTALRSTAGPQEFQVTNQSETQLHIENIEARGDFSQHNNCGNTLEPHQTCTVTAVFQPSSVGRVTGAVRIRDSDVTTSQMVILTGVGVPLDVSPSSFDFGEQKVESDTKPQVLILTNHGTSDVNLRSLAVNGDFAIPRKSCSSTLAPGQSCKVSVSFSPTAGGPRSGLLSIDTGTPTLQTVNLMGIGKESKR